MTSLPAINYQFSFHKLVLISTLFVLFFNGCSKFSLNDKELYPYVEEFVSEGQKRGVKFQDDILEFDIEFGDLPEGKAGSCRKLKELVTINLDLWQLMDSIQRQALIFHELAHCVLDKDHDNSILPRGECVSLMVSNVSDSTCFYDFYSRDWKEYYLDELFGVTDEIPSWYSANTVLNDSHLNSPVLDTITSSYFRLELQDDWLAKDYQLSIDSFNVKHSQKDIRLEWESFSLDLDLIEGTIEVVSHYGPRTNGFKSRVMPRIFHSKQIPKLIDKIVLRKENGFYNVFLNDKHVFKSSMDFPAEFIRDRFGLILYPHERRLPKSLLRLHLLSSEKE